MIASFFFDGKIEVNQNKLETHIENHFSRLFNADFVRQNIGLIQKVIPNLVPDHTNDMLIRMSNFVEIHSIVLSLNIESSPGPDGFGAIFHVHYWDIIKDDVVNVVTQFFLQVWILPNYNAITVVLIPKSKDCNSIDQFRPIAKANFKCKIISKILANRLATILSSLISNEKKGFIADRNIKEGICLTSEAMNIRGNKSFSGKVAIKIDIEMDFDTMNWDFILDTLASFGFSNKFYGGIDSILNSTSLSIGLNGKMVG